MLAAGVGLAALGAAACTAGPGRPRRTEPLAFGVSTPGGPQATAELEAVEAVTGERPSLVLSYVALGAPPPLADLDAVVARGATPMVTWEPWDPADGGRSTLADLAAGVWDGQLWWWAGALRDWGRRVLLRFAHEQNGDWYPWAVGVAGTTARDHVAAWRHLAEVLTQAGADNVELVWNPNVRYPGSTPMAETWPGSGSVGRVALDGYNWGAVPGRGGWQEPAELFGPSLDELRGLAGDLPLLVAEVACAESGGDKAEWVSDLVAWLDEQADVGAFVWFDHDKETDWRLASSPASARAARRALAARSLVGGRR
ncbi:glycoside hydrolase family 26 protein [Geodermatophilus amargosae]|uniref:glycoside hydrolase family 26 protein n=1 Tax=Geodermatophilus amargosae TaxID=1296565 RepID=UPI0034DEEA98